MQRCWRNYWLIHFFPFFCLFACFFWFCSPFYGRSPLTPAPWSPFYFKLCITATPVLRSFFLSGKKKEEKKKKKSRSNAKHWCLSVCQELFTLFWSANGGESHRSPSWKCSRGFITLSRRPRTLQNLLTPFFVSYLTTAEWIFDQ